ncbi:hypothetical protein NDU88_001584 [Pleurodeles waltl]|uniref:Uncharacterized protein n=1 Tax=Pleurodeles waltl TaxID=8319 RepID=A0AAV7VBW2_PLEWA|nr:hypothetical protein NDU88_001584 [Pleurodeles waltl]
MGAIIAPRWQSDIPRQPQANKNEKAALVGTLPRQAQRKRGAALSFPRYPAPWPLSASSSGGTGSRLAQRLVVGVILWGHALSAMQ